MKNQHTLDVGPAIISDHAAPSSDDHTESGWTDCPRCDGEGEVNVIREGMSILDAFMVDILGEADTEPCDYCNGSGGFVTPIDPPTTIDEA